MDAFKPDNAASLLAEQWNIWLVGSVSNNQLCRFADLNAPNKFTLEICSLLLRFGENHKKRTNVIAFSHCLWNIIVAETVHENNNILFSDKNFVYIPTFLL